MAQTHTHHKRVKDTLNIYKIKYNISSENNNKKKGCFSKTTRLGYYTVCVMFENKEIRYNVVKR